MINTFPEINSIQNFGSQIEDKIYQANFKDECSMKFQECFSKIFGDLNKNKIDDNHLNEISETTLLLANIQENKSIKNNINNNFETKAISLKCENGRRKDSFWDLSPISDICKSEKSSQDFTLSDNIEKLFDNKEQKVTNLKLIENNAYINKYNALNEKTKKNRICLS